MTVHITNINGMAINSVAQNAQNMVVDFAKQLGMNEFGIYIIGKRNHYKQEAPVLMGLLLPLTVVILSFFNLLVGSRLNGIKH